MNKENDIVPQNLDLSIPQPFKNIKHLSTPEVFETACNCQPANYRVTAM